MKDLLQVSGVAFGIIMMVFVVMPVALGWLVPGNGLTERFARTIGIMISMRGSRANNYWAVLFVIISLVVTIAAVKNLFECSVLDKLIVKGQETVADQAPGLMTKAAKKFLAIPGMAYLLSGGKAELNTDLPALADGLAATGLLRDNAPIQYPSQWLWWLALACWIFTVPAILLSEREEVEGVVESLADRVGDWQQQRAHNREAAARVERSPIAAAPAASSDGGRLEILRETIIAWLMAKFVHPATR